MFRVANVIAIPILLSIAVPAWAAEPIAKEREAETKPGQTLQQGSQTPGIQGGTSSGPGIQQQSAQPTAGRQTVCSSQASAKSQGSQEPAAGASGQKGQSLKGQFVRMEGEDYVIQDQGKEMCIRTSYATFLDQTFVPGDTITAKLGPDGTAIVIGRVLDTQGQQQTAQGAGQESPMTSGGGSRESTSGTSPAQGSSQRPGMSAEAASESLPSVRGEILTIQGEFYTVKESSGNEVRLHVNKDTKMDGTFQVGDKVEAERSTSGHATRIKKSSETPSAPAGSSSGGSSDKSGSPRP